MVLLQKNKIATMKVKLVMAECETFLVYFRKEGKTNPKRKESLEKSQLNNLKSKERKINKILKTISKTLLNNKIQKSPNKFKIKII